MRQAKLVLIMFSALLVACGGSPEVEIRDVQLELRMERLDRELFGASPEEMDGVSRQAYANYGEFYRIYVEDILQGTQLEDPDLPIFLNLFTNDPDWREAQAAVDSVLGDLEPQRLAFEQAFKRLKVLFPDSLTPRIIAFNSGYNYGIFPTDSVLGVGLEWFIGSDHPVIGLLAPTAFPQYVKDRMHPDMLVPSAMKGWLLVHYAKPVGGGDLLVNLVEVGKIMALLDALLPEVEPALKFAFSAEQLAWCEANEAEIWKELVNRDVLFSKRAADIGRLMNDGPFTNGMPRESPGHIGEWIGYRMVQAYRKSKPKLSFAQLLAEDDARAVLKAYKPR